LVDVCKYTFQLFLRWIYSQNLDGLPVMQSQRREDLALAELWVLAVKLAIPKLQNCALGKISQRYKSTNRVPLDVLSYVYENTTDRSPLRAFWVDKCAWSLSPLEHGKVFSEKSAGRPRPSLVDYQGIESEEV